MLPLLLLLPTAHALPTLRYDPLAATAPAPPVAALPSALVFDEAQAGRKQVELTSSGDVTIHEVVLLAPAGFTLAEPVKPGPLPAFGTTRFHLAWDPKTGGARAGSLLVRTSHGVLLVPVVAEAPRPAPTGGILAAQPSTGVGGLIGAKGTQIGAGTNSPASSAPPPAPPPGGAVAGDPIILGALDKSLMDEVIRARMPDIRACYTRAAAADPGLSGRLIVKFVVANTGAVSSSSVKRTTFPAGDTEACVLSVFDGMRFPEPKSGGIVIASWPFVFAPA